MSSHEIVRVGCGAGFSGDRLDAPGPVVRSLIAHGGPAAIMFETLGERTLALAQLARLENPDAGYEPLLERMLEPVLALCLAHRVRIIGNFGAANPHGAARAIHALAERLGLPRPRIAVVTGDELSAGSIARLEDREDSPQAASPILCANAYLGAEPLVQALATGADIIIAGRVADPSLALAPFAYYHGWSLDDTRLAACGTLAGHLLECGAQVSGGYYADPGYKDVPHPEQIGFPIVAMGADGQFRITRADAPGGLVDRHTVTEQLLYEIHDPGAYLTPDVTLDLTAVELTETGPDEVRVDGARGRPRPERLKVTVSHEAGWLGEGEISYAGPNALARARLAMDVVRRRLPAELRVRGDIIGVASVFNDDRGQWLDGQYADPLAERDIRLRIAATAPERALAQRVPEEVLALYCAGPAGGGGVRTSLRRRIATSSAFIRREHIRTAVEVLP